MKLLSLSFLVLGAASAVAGVCEPKFSIFASDVKRISRQRNVSIAESARMLKAAGVSGFDCSYKEPILPELAKSALKPVNLYGGVDFVAPDGGVAADGGIRQERREPLPFRFSARAAAFASFSALEAFSCIGRSRRPSWSATSSNVGIWSR